MTNRTPIFGQPQKVLGNVHIEIERCKGCELCIDYCPTKILSLSPEFNIKGYHYPVAVEDNCIVCQSCFVICPEFAIFATPSKSTEKLPAA